MKTKRDLVGLSDSKFINTIVELTMSAQRSVPAHFTSTDSRPQSFCVDFDDINSDDEYQMASVAYYEISDYVKQEDKLSKDQFMATLKCGEDIMVSSYICQKLGKNKLIDTVTSKLITEVSLSWPSELKVLEAYNFESVRKWFRYCQEYGVKMAKKTIK